LEHADAVGQHRLQPMLERCFRLADNQMTVRTEILAGVTTFLTMAHIIFVQSVLLVAYPVFVRSRMG
jgi:xanthine/uracil/vitamin C permease (AzgA family)